MLIVFIIKEKKIPYKEIYIKTHLHFILLEKTL